MNFKYLSILFLFLNVCSSEIFAGKGWDKIFNKKSTNSVTKSCLEASKKRSAVIAPAYEEDTDSNELRVSKLVQKQASIKKVVEKTLASLPHDAEVKRVSLWDEEDVDLTTFTSGMENFKKTIGQEMSFALEFDMPHFSPQNNQEAYQELVEQIKKVNANAQLDEGPKAVGLLMLYFKKPTELDPINKLLTEIKGIVEVKDGSKYTKEKRGLTALVDKNKDYINQEALMKLFIEESKLELNEIAKKLKKDPQDIELLYHAVKKKLDQEALHNWMKDIVFNMLDTFKKDKSVDSLSSVTTQEKHITDLDEFEDEEIEDWDAEFTD